MTQRSAPRVLVVDNEPVNRQLLVDLLKHEGYTPLAAAGGREALDVLAKESVDLVLLDIMMPDVDGLAVLAELQRRGALPELLVLVVTAHENRSVRLEALRAGAVDFLTKPIDRVEIACRIRTLIELKQLRQAALQRAEDALRASERRLRLRFEQSPVAEIDLDTELRITGWNLAAERLFGYRRSEAIGQPLDILAADDDADGMAFEWRGVLEGNENSFSRTQLTKDGTEILCQWHNAPLNSPDGRLLGISSVALDISESTRLQEALVQARKMEAIGQLSGGVAHDFNNILSVIISYASFVRDDLPEDAAMREDVDEVLKAADRAAALTKQLLTFSRQRPTAKQPTNLNHSLGEIHNLLARTVGEHITLSVVPSARAVVVEIDPVQFDQVVLNLAVNARDAMPEGGRLRIALESPPDPEDAGLAERWVHLTVTDTGSGIDAATQQRIFEPFFTTKGKGRGTGLGLATCFGIVEDAGGSIRVQSAVGEGTSFVVALPLSGAKARSSQGDGQVPRLGRGETVLVVEDEEGLRHVASRVLRAAGYEVHVAHDGPSGIQQIDRLGSDLDLILSDVVMPGCSGHEVVAHAARVTPDAALLLTSGYLDEEARRGHRTDLPILWKPVAPSDLARAVADALSDARTRSSISGQDERPPTTVSEGPRTEACTESSQAPSRRSAPCSPSQPAPAATASVAPPRVERVLVVEDEPSVASASERILESEGFAVVVARTLGAARRALEEQGFDALVIDIGLPDGSGFDLLPALRGENSDAPVVMITGAPSVESATRAVRGRVDEYLPKPFAAADLLAVVRAAVQRGRFSRLRTKLLAARFGGDEFVGDLDSTERSFAQALTKIRMVFQPIVRAADHSVFGYEALLRCDEPSLASPQRMLAAAEVLGRVTDVGRAVRREVAVTMTKHQGRLEAIFINLHPSEVRSDLLGAATEPLVSLAPRVVLEVTERAHLRSGPRLDDDLRRIRELGYRLAVDDLGEGYAGLSSLVTLQPDIAKIDMSLVRDVDRAPLKRDIIAAIVDLARRSGIVVVAEGVESVEERDTLVELGCDLLQGYLFAKPGPAFPGLSGP